LTPREAGFLLLTSHLGDPERKILTVAQLRLLARRMQLMVPVNGQRQVEPQDLVGLGYDRQTAERIVALLMDDAQLQWYVKTAQKQDCCPITRVTDGYPGILRQRLGLDAPGCLWAKGDVGLLAKPAVSLVGSRDLMPENGAFAREVGIQAARQGYALVSGNARGADRTAQDACLEAGGCVISVVADSLTEHAARERVLWLSEDGFELPFSRLRALSRNRIIHGLGEKTFVAQCTHGKGGTWDGTVRNLRQGLSPVFCFRDDSDGTRALSDRGAQLIRQEDLADFQALQPNMLNFIDQ